MATGLAIMGFGGGAFIGANLSLMLIDAFKSATSTGVAAAFVAMGAIYFLFVTFGAFIVRVPAEGWKPAGYAPPARPQKPSPPRTTRSIGPWRSRQFRPVGGALLYVTALGCWNRLRR